MIEHIVFFKWQPEASPEAIAKAMAGLKGMKAQIPEILYLSCGENFSEKAQGFQHGFVTRFASREDLNTYHEHPAHQEVVHKLLEPIWIDIIALDYEII